ncbi:hypothetical protein IP87_07095 [beta proteobacterium AAP121]|nr:hypothetical protein IP80_17670 [beta proteobacterium AAP65]KPF98890.1 hypothetical protein IP87_07095 [beta proteobacterium AAP121]
MLACLRQVEEQRQARLSDPGLGRYVEAVKAYQHGRFAESYADLLAHARFGDAARFFLEDLYGPGDFSLRDQQFARVVPALVRLFPRDIVETVLSLGRLHALSEALDTAMAHSLRAHGVSSQGGEPSGRLYGLCWRAVAGPADRERQISLMLGVGRALDNYTRNPLLRHTLRLMRAPAQAAGLAALQTFLERGFDTFRAMKGAEEFLRTIAERERTLAAALFAGADGPDLPLSP